MKKKIFTATVIGLCISAGAAFADATIVDTTVNAGSRTILEALNTPHFNAASKDDNYSWLMSVLLIGRKVEVQSGISILYKDEGMSGAAMVPQAASDIKVNVADTNGNIIKALELGAAKTAGMVDFKWDGMSANGKPGEAGPYKISATASINGKTTQLATAGDFKVKSVGMGPNGPILNLDSLGGVGISSIIKIL